MVTIEGLADVQSELELWLARAGSYRALGEELGIDYVYLHKVIHGKKPPSARLLDLLGFERVVEYRRA